MKGVAVRGLVLCAGLLSAGAALAATSALEIPQPDSTQSGIGVVSGWHCNAGKIEVAFDGGPRILAAYGTTREDTRGVCGDANNGFSLLWAYGLLGAGPHQVVAYADGVEFGRSTFIVSDLANKGFLEGKTSQARVYGFPAPEHDIVLRWEEANQNYVIVGPLQSINSYDVNGVWELFDGATSEGLLSWFTYPQAESYWMGKTSVFHAWFDGNAWRSTRYAGTMQEDTATISASTATGAATNIEYEVVFTDHRHGVATVTRCTPAYLCRHPVGDQLQLVKQQPSEEDAIYANGGALE